MVDMSLVRYGDHTTDAYSRCGRMNEPYSSRSFGEISGGISISDDTFASGLQIENSGGYHQIQIQQDACTSFQGVTVAASIQAY